MKTIQAELPEKLYEQLKSLVDEGWFTTEKDLIIEALRRFLESHKPGLMEQFVREDTQWGLYGKD